VKIELTSQCNYRCGFCAHRLRMKGRGEMDRAFYERVVGEMADAGVEELGMFYIGESFMCDWLPEAIAFAKKRGIRYVFLTTNGSLATPPRVSACMRAGLDSLKFSMNNADEEQFEQIAAVKSKLFRDSVLHLKAARGVRDLGGYKCGIYASSIQYDGEQQQAHARAGRGDQAVRRRALLAAALFHGQPHDEARGGAGLPADCRKPGAHRRAARAAARAGRRSPRATSRTTASFPPAASTPATSG
jgi:hypothetical protein